MMITAHGAAAMLAKLGYAKASQKNDLLTPINLGKMFIFGILPDIPLTILVISGRFDPAIHYHHTWITHTPIFWIAISALVMWLFSASTGVELLCATLLHLDMDWYGGADGIPFLYPLTNTQFGMALSHVNGAGGLSIYLSNPLFLFLEIAIQGSCLLIVLLYIARRFSKKRNN